MWSKEIQQLLPLVLVEVDEEMMMQLITQHK